MTSRTNQTKLTIYRRHASTCPLVKDSRILDQCECPLWIHGKLHGAFLRKSLDTRSEMSAFERKRAMIANAPATAATGPQALTKTAGHLMTLECAGAAFLEASKALASNTRKLYARAVADFCQWAAGRNLHLLTDVDSSHVRAYFDAHAKTWNRTTAQGRLTHLRVWFNYCSRTRRWIPFPPTEDRTLNQRAKKQSSTSSRTPFAPEEITRILAAVEQLPAADADRARALIYLLLYTGMRISDATFFERAFLTERGTADFWIIKTKRQVALPPEVQQPALDALAKLPPSRVYFFWGDRSDDYHEARQALRNGEEFSISMPGYESRIREMTALVKKVLQQAGISGACHRFRDTFAITLLTGGADLYTVSKMLGHSDPKITDKAYLKLLPGYREQMSQATRRLAYHFPVAS